MHRLARAPHAALDGEGARQFGGRWNSPGAPMIYAAASPSLAVLEVLVHLDLPLELIPEDYRLFAIEVPDEAPAERLETSPEDEQACTAHGDAFLRRGEALVLRVPSAIVPQESNALLNPRHPAAVALTLRGSEPFTFDRRLFR